MKTILVPVLLAAFSVGSGAAMAAAPAHTSAKFCDMQDPVQTGAKTRAEVMRELEAWRKIPSRTMAT
ncbi:MAG: hypothetical protein H0W48_00965 [Methylibium sp.]|nr:hypothetical protein [Methylibium sp.]